MDEPLFCFAVCDERVRSEADINRSEHLIVVSLNFMNTAVGYVFIL